MLGILNSHGQCSIVSLFLVYKMFLTLCLGVIIHIYTINAGTADATES